MFKRSILIAGALALALAGCGDDGEGDGSAGEAGPGRDADDLLEPAAAGRRAGAVRGGGQRRQAGARAGRQQGREVPGQVRLARRLHGAGRRLGAQRGLGQRAQGRSATTPRSATSASSTRAGRRSRCRSSTRPASRRSARATPRSASPPTTPAPRPASRTSTTRPASGPTPACCPRTPTRAPRSSRWPRRRAAPRRYIINDKEVYGAGLAKNVELSAKKQGLEIKGNDGIDKNAANYRSVAQRIKGTGAQCFIYSGITANNAVQIFKDIADRAARRAADRPRGRRRDRLLRS